MTTSVSNPRAARFVFIAVGVVLVLVTTTIVLIRNIEPAAQLCGQNGTHTTVRGIVGSEKEPFFNDERVRARFDCLGLPVTIDPSGSRQMLTALTAPNHGYSFAFPASTPTAEKLTRELKITERIPVFSSPMAVATFEPIVNVLTKAGVVQHGSDGNPVVSMPALLDLARNDTRWNQLPGNADYPVNKAVLLSTTDPQDSNSGIMYLSIASYVANGNVVVTRSEQVQQLLPDLCRLVYDQGEKPETSQVLFNYYLVDGLGGMSRIPLALIYEAQFVAEAPGQKPNLTPDRVLLYPGPTVYSRHTLVPLDEAGRRVGQALRDDPELVRLAAEHGFRPERSVDHPVHDRPAPVDVVESPSFDMLENMIAALAAKCPG
jgi:hypothetical protein